MVNRSFGALLLVAFLGAVPLVAEAQRWSEADVLQIARESAPAVVAAEGRVTSTRALRDGAGRYPDPTLSWQREALVQGVEVSQDIVALTVPVDLSGRRSAQRTVVDSSTASAEAQAIDARSNTLAAALAAFYEGIAAEERVTIAERAMHALDEAHRVVARREAEGTAAGMDVMRLNLELELAASFVATSRIEAQQAIARLGLVLGRHDLVQEAATRRLTLVGDLEVELARPLTELLDGAEGQPVLEALERASRLGDEADAAAGSAWIPPLSLTAGVNITVANETQLGYFAGVSIPLAFFNQGRSVMASAHARRAIATTQLDARQRQATADVVAAHQRLVAMDAEATRLASATEGSLEGLLRAANSGYAEGRRTLVELLDARRAAVNVATRRLSLRLEAKRAEIELRRALGDLQ